MHLFTFRPTLGAAVLGAVAAAAGLLRSHPGSTDPCVPGGRWTAVRGDSFMPAVLVPPTTLRIGTAEYIARVDETREPHRLLLESVVGHILLEAPCETGGVSVGVMTFTAPAVAAAPSDPVSPSELPLFRDPRNAEAAAQAYRVVWQQFVARG